MDKISLKTTFMQISSKILIHTSITGNKFSANQVLANSMNSSLYRGKYSLIKQYLDLLYLNTSEEFRPENVRLKAEHALCCSGNHSKGCPLSLVCTPGRPKKT
jgi:hypothetical protein